MGPRGWKLPQDAGRDAPLACRGQGRKVAAQRPFTNFHHRELNYPLTYSPAAAEDRDFGT